jgi:alpha-mannosidase
MPDSQMNRREWLGVMTLPLAALAPASAQTSGSWPAGSGRFEFYMIGGSHIDPVWLWPWPEGLSVVHSTFRAALDRMNETPDFRFTASSAQFYEWVAENDPKMMEEIRARVTEGRWAIVGGWWVEPDINMPSGEALARQGLYGQMAFRRLFGRIARVGYNSDSFGHTGTLPQILHLQGMDNYVFMRPQVQEKKLPADLFWWEAPDGTRVLTFRIALLYGEPGSVDKDLRVMIAERGDQPLQMGFYGVGDHGGGATKANIQSILALMDTAGAPKARFSAPEAYFEAVRSSAIRIPAVKDDLQMHAVGCYTAECEVKKNNRSAEILLVTAEKLAALNSLLTGAKYPKADFDDAWKKVLFLQFHDSLAGSSLPQHYSTSARYGHGYVREVAEQAIYRSAQKIAWQIPTQDPESHYLVLLNPHAWEASLSGEYELDWPPAANNDNNLREPPTVLEDETGKRAGHQWVRSETVSWRKRLALQGTVPAFGYRQFRLHGVAASVPPPALAHADEKKLENDHLRVTFTGDGTIDIFDKDANRPVFASGSPGARGLIFDDPSDTWSHHVVEYSNQVGAFGNATFRVLENGPWRARVQVRSTYGESSLKIDWLLCGGSRHLEARVALDWHEHLKILKLSFPVDVEQPVPTCEIAYGHFVRSTDNHEVPGQRWVDVSGKRDDKEYGVAVINDAKYGYSFSGSDMRISIARGTVYAWHIPHTLEPNGVYNWQDQGLQNFRMLLAPHSGMWQDAGIVRLAEEFTTPVPIIFQGIHRGDRAPSGSFLSVDVPNVVVTAVKKAEDGDDLIVRCYETAGRPVRATVDLGLIKRRWSGEFRASEIKTLRVPAGGGEIREVNILEE